MIPMQTFYDEYTECLEYSIKLDCYFLKETENFIL